MRPRPGRDADIRLSFSMATTDWQVRICPKSSNVVQPRHAVEAIIETTRDHRESLTVACLGPLTNLAVALRLEPRLCQWIRQSHAHGRLAWRRPHDADHRVQFLVRSRSGEHRVRQRRERARRRLRCDPPHRIFRRRNCDSCRSRIDLPPGLLAMSAASISNDSKRYGGCRIRRSTARLRSCRW